MTKLLQIDCSDGESVIVTIDPEQTVVITEMVEEKIHSRVVLLEEEAMAVACFLFEEMEVNEGA